MINQNLPGIKKIEYCHQSEMEIVPLKKYHAGDIVSPIGNFTELPIVDLASCEVSPEETEHGNVYTTIIETLSTIDMFSRTSHILLSFYFIYRITDIYNNQYLIGIKQRPFPSISITNRIDRTPSGQRVSEVKITFKSTIPPLNCSSL